MKKIVLSSDHGGFYLKEFLAKELKGQGFEIVDLGPTCDDRCSYAEKGQLLAEYIQKNKDALGIGICGSGIGMSIAVNRYKGIRGALITSEEYAQLAKKHNNANILVFGGRFISETQAMQWINTFLNETFEGGRHIERIEQLDK